MTSEILQFTFQPYALLSLFAVVIDSTLAIYILKKGSQNLINKWFALVLFCMTIWGLSEIVSRISASPAATIFWTKIGAPGWIFVGAVFFCFTLVFIGKERILNNILLPGFLFGFSFLLLFLEWNTHLITVHTESRYFQTFYGWNEPKGPLFPILVIWIVGFFIISLIFLFKYYRESKEGWRKKQTLFIIAGCSVPLISGTITDGILPIFQKSGSILPTAVLFTPVLAILIAFAILKYKLFIISPSTAIQTIIETMGESLIVISPTYRINMANKAAFNFLEYTEKELLGEHIQKIITPGNTWKAFQERGLVPLARGKEVRNLETEFVTKSGRTISINFSANPIKSPGEELVGIVAVATDISQLKTLIRKYQVATKELEGAKYALERKIGKIIEPD